MMLFPHYISWVVVSYILLAIFSNKNGLANQLLNALGMKSVSWYTKADVWPTILVWMKIWKSAGMNAVIYLAAITGIDESIYESATIDGANRFQRIVSITVPLIMPTVCIMTLLAVGKIMNGDFGYMVSVKNNKIDKTPLQEVAGRLKMVEPDSDIVKEAKTIGISFGD